MTRSLTLLLSAALLATGCAVGNVHNYRDAAFPLAKDSGQAVAVAVQDQRPYVLDGNKGPEFVGLSRGGFGNPFSVTTASGQPMADDMARAVASSLETAGYRPTVVALSPKEGMDAVRAKLAAARAPRALLLVVREWKSDTYMGTSLTYDLTLSVLDTGGAVLADKSDRGKRDLGASAWNPPAHARKAAPEMFSKMMGEFLSDEAIRKALK
jgi:hypothetical protein